MFISAGRDHFKGGKFGCNLMTFDLLIDWMIDYLCFFLQVSVTEGNKANYDVDFDEDQEKAMWVF